MSLDDPAPKIQSIGAPPERHAKRVVAEMCRWLAREELRLDGLLKAHFARLRTRLGSPVAQRRFVDRLGRSAAGKGFLELFLWPGKRGKFKLAWITWGVVTPIEAMPVKAGAMPETPWLAVNVETIRGDGDMPCQAYREITFSHHAMVRLAMRSGARTPDDLLDTLRDLWAEMVKAGGHHADAGTIRSLPVRGGGVAIAKKAGRLGWLIKTILEPHMNGATDA